MSHSINEAEILIKKLMVFYNVFTISELANVIGVSQPSISGWKKHNYVKAIANKCKELGIYNDIFKDFNNIDNVEKIAFEQYFDEIFNFYNVNTLKDLSEITNIPISTMSSIKQRNSITALKKKCRELGIYNEIFKNTNKEDLKIEVLEKSLFNDNINKTLEIINTMTKDNKELENKFDQFLKDFVKNNL